MIGRRQKADSCTFRKTILASLFPMSPEDFSMMKLLKYSNRPSPQNRVKKNRSPHPTGEMHQKDVLRIETVARVARHTGKIVPSSVDKSEAPRLCFENPLPNSVPGDYITS